jgi:hypothetical protein
MEAFSVRVEARAPEGNEDVLDEAAVDELTDLIEEYEGAVSYSLRAWDATVTVPAVSARLAVEQGAALIEELAAKAGLPSWSAVIAEAVRHDVVDEQLARNPLPALVSAPEAADILGVSSQRVHQIAADNKDFPRPAYELRAGNLWLQNAVEAFAERKRTPGRPRKPEALAI